MVGGIKIKVKGKSTLDEERVICCGDINLGMYLSIESKEATFGLQGQRLGFKLPLTYY